MINPHANHPTSLAALMRSLWQHRDLITQMSRREVVGRYRGSIMGIAWSFFNPIRGTAIQLVGFTGFPFSPER